MEERIKEAKLAIQNAEYIIIGAGAGLSEAAGFHYSGERFDKYFSDFKGLYGISDMYSGTFYNFETKEEKWAFWSRMIHCNTYNTKPTSVYQQILNLIHNKKYFVITTNVDNQFSINNFDMNHYFETQGNYSYFQCEKGCHKKVYDNQEIIKNMVLQTKNCRIPKQLLPICPICNNNMDVHVRKNEYFIETDGWYKYRNKYKKFLKQALKHKVVFLEFGVGFNTPTIIRYPFEDMVYHHKDATLIRFNKDYPLSLKGNKTISFSEDILNILSKLQEIENISIHTLKKGADDYILKDIVL